MISSQTTLDEIKKFKNLLEYFKRLSEDGVTPLIEKQLLQMLEFSIPFFAHLIDDSVFPEIQRLTINKNIQGSNKRIRDINHLKYPPADKVSRHGRCNLPKQSVLYAGLNWLTILSELRPKVGDLITHSTWKVKNNEAILFCPIFKNQPKGTNLVNPTTRRYNQLYNELLRQYPVPLQEQIDCLVQFIADAFSKVVGTNHLDYIFSSFFSNVILNEFENGKIEGIYYPSVKENLHFENLALKPEAFDKKYELIKVSESVVVQDLSKGSKGYLMEGISNCKNFDFASGKILWDAIESQNPNLNMLKRLYNIDLN